MPTFKADEFERFLKKAVNEVLATKVTQTVEDAIVMAVDSTVYDSGDPKYYKRRKIYQGSGGLGDHNQLESIVIDGTLSVTDNAKFKGGGFLSDPIDTNKSLAENIIEGYGDKAQWFNAPRDFIQTAHDDLEESGSLANSFKLGLEQLGFKVIRG